MRFKGLAVSALSSLALSSCADPIITHQMLRPSITIPEKQLVYDGLDINVLSNYLNTGRRVRWVISENEHYDFDVTGRNSYEVIHLRKTGKDNKFVYVRESCGKLDEKTWGQIRNRFYVLRNFPAD